MPDNRRRHANAIPLASLATWIVIGIFACGSGLGYVWCKNQLHATGDQIRHLERELLDLRSRNEVARSKIEQFSSVEALNARYKTGFINNKHFHPITYDKIVNLTGKAAPAAKSGLRPVANERHQE